MYMQYGHGHAAWTWTHSTALVMQHGSGNEHAWMQECWNADKKSVSTQLCWLVTFHLRVPLRFSVTIDQLRAA
jgi:hypothetical protein